MRLQARHCDVIPNTMHHAPGQHPGAVSPLISPLLQDSSLSHAHPQPPAPTLTLKSTHGDHVTPLTSPSPNPASNPSLQPRHAPHGAQEVVQGRP